MAKDSNKYNYTIRDFKDYEPQVIAEILHDIYLSHFVPGNSPKDYYCGIATDVDSRFSYHENNDWEIAEILAVIDCGDPQGEKPSKAARVEKFMGDRKDDLNPAHKYYGLDIGERAGNGEGDHTRYVYLVKKAKKIST